MSFLFEENIADIRENYKDLFIPQVSFALWPEPHERYQFFVSLILFGLTSFHLTKFVNNQVRGLPDLSRLITWLFILLSTTAVVWLWLTLRLEPILIFAEEENIYYQEIRKMFHNAFSVKNVMASAVIFLLLNLKIARHATKLSYIAFSFIMLAILLLVNIGDSTNYLGIPDHFNAVFYSLDQVVKGKTLLVDLHNQYGLYPHFLSPLFDLIGLGAFTHSVTFSTITILCYLCIYIFLFRCTKDHFVSSITLIAILYSRAFSYIEMNAYEPYFQYTPIRFFFPCLLLVLVQNYITSPSKAQYHLISFVCSVSILWNFESGFVVFISWVLIQIYEKLSSYRAVSLGFLRSIFWPLLQTTSMLAFVVFGYCVLMFLRSGAWLDLESFFKFHQIFYLSGFFMMHMPVVHLWNIIISIYVFGFTYAISGALPMMQSKLKFNTEVFLVSSLGFGLFLYYQGRSHDYNLLNVSYPAVILLGMTLSRFDTKLPWNTLNGATARVILGAFVFLSSFALFSIDKASSKVTQALMTIQNFIDNGEMVPSHLADEVEFIKTYTNPGEKVIILFNEKEDGILYNLTQTKSVLSVPGGSERPMVSEYEIISAYLNSNKAIKVFSRGNHFYEPINDSLDLYHSVLVQHNDLKLWFPKKARPFKQYFIKPLIRYGWIYGCSGKERLEKDTWTWCENKFGLLLQNVDSEAEDLNITLSFEANTGHEEQSFLFVQSKDFEQKIKISNEPGIYKHEFNVKAGEKIELNFYTDAKKVHAPADPRSLFVRVRKFDVRF